MSNKEKQIQMNSNVTPIPYLSDFNALRYFRFLVMSHLQGKRIYKKDLFLLLMLMREIG